MVRHSCHLITVAFVQADAGNTEDYVKLRLKCGTENAEVVRIPMSGRISACIGPHRRDPIQRPAIY